MAAATTVECKVEAIVDTQKHINKQCGGREGCKRDPDTYKLVAKWERINKHNMRLRLDDSGFLTYWCEVALRRTGSGEWLVVGKPQGRTSEGVVRSTFKVEINGHEITIRDTTHPCACYVQISVDLDELASKPKAVYATL